ncbi:MAG: prepilin-type N-terminal cleavage/methylation domain-containing protein, partial [Myxococcales bacterium]|nr:prepilin-type N-terminal cleavage/methylation domain-containing protein [Myxococcales bacterium]
MARQRRQRLGFTLIELMIVVAIIGVLASIALPAFERFVMESKSSEAYANLGLMSRGAAAYYERESADQGLGSTTVRHCTIVEPGPFISVPPLPPTPEKRAGDFEQYEAYHALGFMPSDALYFAYAFENI